MHIQHSTAKRTEQANQHGRRGAKFDGAEERGTRASLRDIRGRCARRRSGGGQSDRSRRPSHAAIAATVRRRLNVARRSRATRGAKSSLRPAWPSPCRTPTLGRISTSRTPPAGVGTKGHVAERASELRRRLGLVLQVAHRLRARARSINPSFSAFCTTQSRARCLDGNAFWFVRRIYTVCEAVDIGPCRVGIDVDRPILVIQAVKAFFKQAHRAIHRRPLEANRRKRWSIIRWCVDVDELTILID